MKRKVFVKTCSAACLGISILGILPACSSAITITANLDGKYLTIPKSTFKIEKDDKIKYRRYVVAENERLKYPVCIYRFDDNNYKAILMRCTHQGTELRAFGDRLQCPAHGSEFNNQGKVTHGPADKDLRTFPIEMDNIQLKVALT